MNDKLFLWAPNIFEFKGGIQTFSHFLLKALKVNLPDDEIEVFLKHDSHVPKEERSDRIRFRCFGSIPHILRTMGYSIGLFTTAFFSKPKLIITTHLHFAPVAALLNLTRGIPYWIVTHGTEVWGNTSTAHRFALHKAERVLAVSSLTRDRLLAEQELPESKVLVLPNTFDEKRFSLSGPSDCLRSKLEIPKGRKIILTVARLDSAERMKGYDIIIKALPEIIKRVPDAHYLLVGKGPDRERIVNLLNSYDLSDRVTLAGFIPDEDLPEYYSLCDLYAMPGEGEGFGIVYLEAIACGKPVLAGNRDGSVDALANGELGVLVDPRDIKEVTDTISLILSDNFEHPLLYDPKELRAAVLQRFGFIPFSAQLKKNLDSFDKGPKNL